MPELVPANPDFKKPASWLERTPDNYVDWIDSIKTRRKSHNDFSISAKLAEIMLLTNIATRVQNSNKILEYDAENMRITNVPEANDLFHYQYRKGWSL
jgi:hypothetical protein